MVWKGRINMSVIQTGIYQHYKGPKYEVLGESRHSETEEVLVIYRALYGEFGIWVRPMSMFLEQVEMNGVLCPRFSLLEAYPITLGQYANKVPD